uniref:ShKT domain-containing protein n=1 Tax=Meloidogyne hapla TaxID=6305 RepID=A0A1I8BB27_MELHA
MLNKLIFIILYYLFNFTFISSLPSNQNNQNNQLIQQNKNFQNIQRSISGCLFCSLCGLPEIPSSSWIRPNINLKPKNKCEDQSSKCNEFLTLCDDEIYKHFLRSHCAYTCGICKETLKTTIKTKTILTTTLIPKITKYTKTSIKPKITTKTFKTTLKQKSKSQESNEQTKNKLTTNKTIKIKENTKEIIKTTTTIPKTIEGITDEVSIEENTEEPLEECEDIGQNCKAMESGCQDMGQRHILGTFCRKTCKFSAIGGDPNPCQSPLLQKPGLTLTEELIDGQKVCCGFDKQINGYLPDGQKEDLNLRKRPKGSKLICKSKKRVFL